MNILRYKTLAIILFFLFITTIFWFPIIPNINNLGCSDWDQLFSLHEVPLKTILEYHQFPFWNPYSCGGVSLIGNPQARFFSPSIIYTLLSGTIMGVKLEILTHLFIGLLGMYFLMRHLGIKGISSLIPSILFMLNSKYALHLHEGHTFWLTIAYLPLVFLFYLKSLEQKKYIFASAFFIALMIFEGGTYIVIATVFGLGIYSLLNAIRRKRLRPLITIVIIFLFSILFSAPKLLPSTELMFQYPRIIDCDDFIPLEYLDEIFLHDKHELNGRQFMSKYYWHEYGANLGIMPLVLFAVSAVVLIKKWWPLILTGVLFFFLGLGNFSPYSPWNILQKLPVFNLMRVPSRFLIFFIFAFSILTGLLIYLFEKRQTIDKILKYTLLLSLLGFLVFDLIKVNSVICRESFQIKNVFQKEHGLFRQTKQGPDYGAYSSMYPLILKNLGVVDAYEPIPVEINAVPSDDENYRGEFYLLEGKGEVSLSYWSPNKITLDLDMDNTDTLVINQNYDKGWKTYSSLSIKPTKGLLSLQVTPSVKKITLFYFPYSFLVGMLFSILGILLFIFRKRIRFLI